MVLPEIKIADATIITPLLVKKEFKMIFEANVCVWIRIPFFFTDMDSGMYLVSRKKSGSGGFKTGSAIFLNCACMHCAVLVIHFSKNNLVRQL